MPVLINLTNLNSKIMYKIISSSRYGTEQVDQADTLKEAIYLVREYRLAFGSGFSIYIKKGRKIVA